MKRPAPAARQFQFNLGSLVGWEYSAQALRDAADALFRFHHEALRRLLIQGDNDLQDRNYVGSGRIILMLAGFAIENLAKGLWVQQNPHSLTSGRLPRELKGHERTIDLLAAAKAPLSPCERAFLRKLQTFVVWEGRYPVPTKVEKLTSNVFQTDEFERFSKLFDRLKALLNKRWKEEQA